MPTDTRQEIGWEEWVGLPELKLPAIKAKVDTVAKTSALHVFMVEKIIEDDNEKVRFGIHPVPERPEIEIFCKAHLVDEREVISSNGQIELRYVIRTMAQFGKKKWPIEITLTDRENMAYRMLIGRSAMDTRLIVVPGKSFLLGVQTPGIYDAIVPQKLKKRKLKLCILSRASNAYATHRLVSVAESRGHQVEVVNTTRCYVDISSHKPAIHYQGHIIPRFDAVIPRLGPSVTFYGVALLRHFESLGTFCVNGSNAIAQSRDRLCAHQLLGRAGVSMPTTTFAHYPGDTKDMIKIVGGAPLVIKLLDGPEGKGIVLAETNKAAEAVIQAFRGLKANFIAQEYIAEKNSKDIRCIVIGSKVVASVQRIESKSEFHDKTTRDRFKLIKISKVEKNIAVRAAKVLGLKFASVNLLRTNDGPKIIDVDSAPTIAKIENATGIDIAALLIDYVETHARPRIAKRVLGYR